jgi:hypothetical protein
MKVLAAAALAFVLAPSLAYGQDEDDDPKAAPRHGQPAKPKPAPAPSPTSAAKPKPVAEAVPAVAAPDMSPRKKSPPPPDARAAKPEPKAELKADPKPDAKPAAPAPAAAVADAPAAGAARPVRVRLLDGSTVVGQVRVEQAEALVIDCALGQLSIPRARISTIAYDAAAGVGKRAPVQLLDDGDTLPKKK